ncbi:uncharacterized protein TNCV_3695681 [Trichonephila clavipes]|nr:uncharacterized protein TNCV_3695681 [Trichonephila clavipes]
MDVCKCLVPSRQGDALNSRRAASRLVKLVEEERWVAPEHPQRHSQNWGGNEQIRTVTCMMLKAKANDKRKNVTLSCDESRGLDLMLLLIRWHKQQQLYLLVT